MMMPAQPMMMGQDPQWYHQGGYQKGGNKGYGKGGERTGDGTCNEFTRTGSCRFGATCRFKHEGKPTGGTRITSRPDKETTDIPADLIIDYDRVEGEKKGAKAILWTDHPLMHALMETETNSANEKVSVNKVIAAYGPIATKMQQIALHAHAFAKGNHKDKLGYKKADELLDDLLVICKQRAPFPYRLAESSEEAQEVKDDITEIKSILKVVATTAQSQQTKLHELEVKSARRSSFSSAHSVGGSSSMGNAFSESAFGDTSSEHRRPTTFGAYSPSGIPTPMSRRPAKRPTLHRRSAGLTPGNARRPATYGPPPGLHAAFDDEADLGISTDEGEETDVFSPTGNGGAMPRMPSMVTTVRELCIDPVRKLQAIPNEELGWKFTEQLTQTATAALKAFKRAPKASQDPFSEAAPLSDKYKDLQALKPIQENGTVHTINLEDLGRLATIFVPQDFSFANDVYIDKILKAVQASQSPLKRIAAYLHQDGIVMGGLPSFKLGPVFQDHNVYLCLRMCLRPFEPK